MSLGLLGPLLDERLVGRVRAGADLHEGALLVVNLERRMVDAEALVKKAFELEADGVAVIALVNEDVGGE